MLTSGSRNCLPQLGKGQRWPSTMDHPVAVRAQYGHVRYPRFQLVRPLQLRALGEGVEMVSLYVATAKWVCPVCTDCLPLSYSTSSHSSFLVL